MLPKSCGTQDGCTTRRGRWGEALVLGNAWGAEAFGVLLSLRGAVCSRSKFHSEVCFRGVWVVTL